MPASCSRSRRIRKNHNINVPHPIPDIVKEKIKVFMEENPGAGWRKIQDHIKNIDGGPCVTKASIEDAMEELNLTDQQEPIEIIRQKACPGGIEHYEEDQWRDVIDVLLFIAKMKASVNFPIFLGGESGTGKSYIANKLIHKLIWGNEWEKHPFVRIDCAAFESDPGVICSNIFGHKKGSFTGADDDKVGKVREAQNGTLFIDEVAKIDLPTQARFLTFVQTKKYSPIGGKEEDVDAKFIFASNENLKELMNQGKFIPDLYYRIGDHVITLPPLRERGRSIIKVARVVWKAEICRGCKKPELSCRNCKESFPDLLGEILAVLFDPLQADKMFIPMQGWAGNLHTLKQCLRRFYEKFIARDRRSAYAAVKQMIWNAEEDEKLSYDPNLVLNHALGTPFHNAFRWWFNYPIGELMTLYLEENIRHRTRFHPDTPSDLFFRHRQSASERSKVELRMEDAAKKRVSNLNPQELLDLAAFNMIGAQGNLRHQTGWWDDDWKRVKALSTRLRAEYDEIYKQFQT